MDSPDPDDSSVSGNEGPDPRGDEALGVEPSDLPEAQDPARSALDLVLALGLLVVVLTLGLVAVLVTTDDDINNTANRITGGNAEPTGSPSGSPSHDGSTTAAVPEDDPQRPDDSQRIITAIAERFGRDYDGIVTDTQAECMARAWVDVVGVERVPQLGEPGSATDSEIQQISAAMRHCVGPETATQLNLE